MSTPGDLLTPGDPLQGPPTPSDAPIPGTTQSWGPTHLCGPASSSPAQKYPEGWRESCAKGNGSFTTFQGLPRAGCPGLEHPIQWGQDPESSKNTRSGHTAGHCASGKQTPHPAPTSKPATKVSHSAPVRSSDLGQVPAKELDRFVQDHLRPSSHLQKLVGQALDAILRHLRQHSVHRISRACKVSPHWGHWRAAGEVPTVDGLGGQASGEPRGADAGPER